MMGKNEKVCPLKTVFVGLRTFRIARSNYDRLPRVISYGTLRAVMMCEEYKKGGN